MKTKIENLSFIVLISFQFGIGTNRTYSSEAISDLKKSKCFIDKCSNRDVIPNEVVISNVEGVKYEIDLRFLEFVERTGKEPEYVECQIVWKETGDDKRVTIKLSLSINDDDNDAVFLLL